GALRCGRRDQGPRRVLSRPRRRDQLTDAGGLASVPRARPQRTKLRRVPATTHAVAGTLPGVWHKRAMKWSRPPRCKTRRSCSKRSIHFSISETTRRRAVLVIELPSTQRAYPTWARPPVQFG